MDDTSQPTDSPAPSPAKSKTATVKKTSGRGVTKKTNRKATTKPTSTVTTRSKGRGRNKAYDDPRSQAAYERMKEIRDLYTDVVGAVKPALEELADQELKKLLEDPTAHQELEEFTVLQRQLDERLEATIRAADQEYDARTATTICEYENHTAVTQKRFHDSFSYHQEEFYDGARNRVTILSELRQEGCDLSLTDGSYHYVVESDDIINKQGPRVVLRNGVEVPYPTLLEKRAIVKPQGRKSKVAGKRKAEDQPDGQPDSKKASTTSGSFKLDNGGDAPTPRPRHIAGLLSAETDLDGEQESNAPSPSPLNEGQSPGPDSKTDTSSKKREIPDLPSGASEPDAWGVRTVNRRGTRANNRLIIPPAFEWDDDEIGFQDSTNDSTRKATKATRGKYLNKPNSRTWHLDRTILTYDCLENKDGDLDLTLVKKHQLHSKYGFFLSDSINKWEPPRERVDGTRPVVVLTPNGTTLQASRSVRATKMDHALAMDAQKDTLSKMLVEYCEEEDIQTKDIVTEEILERQRQIDERMDDNEAGTEGATSVADASFDEAADERLARERAEQLLQAAAFVEFERPDIPPPGPRPSRPYDAVRDVFTNAEPAFSTAIPTPDIDTSRLSLLADISDKASAELEKSNVPVVSYIYQPGWGDDKIDPRLLGPLQPIVPRAEPPAAQNAFLQTALNPTPPYAPIAPAPGQGSESTQQNMPARNPFTHQRNTTGSPVLPALRPSRREPLFDVPPQHPPPPPQGLPYQGQEFGSPHNLIQAHSGSYYPPPALRPYHHSYSIHEPPSIMTMQSQQGPFVGGLGAMSAQQPPPLPPYPHHYPAMSPIMHGQAQLPAMPLHMPPRPSESPPSPPAPGTRQRGSNGSNGSNSAKYRRIAAAPIPYNKPWHGNGAPELRVAQYDHKESIKDYRATEPTPHSRPITVRGWSINNSNRGRNKGIKREEAEEREPPNITPYINKWNSSERSQD